MGEKSAKRSDDDEDGVLDDEGGIDDDNDEDEEYEVELKWGTKVQEGVKVLCWHSHSLPLALPAGGRVMMMVFLGMRMRKAFLMMIIKMLLMMRILITTMMIMILAVALTPLDGKVDTDCNDYSSYDGQSQ